MSWDGNDEGPRRARFRPSRTSQSILQFTLEKGMRGRGFPFRPGPLQHVCAVLDEAWESSVESRGEPWGAVESRGERWEFFVLDLPMVCSLVSLVCEVPPSRLSCFY